MSTTLVNLFVKKLFNKFKSGPFIQYNLRLYSKPSCQIYSKPSCQTLSKALDMSKKTPLVSSEGQASKSE